MYCTVQVIKDGNPFYSIKYLNLNPSRPKSAFLLPKLSANIWFKSETPAIEVLWIDPVDFGIGAQLALKAVKSVTHGYPKA